MPQELGEWEFIGGLYGGQGQWEEGGRRVRRFARFDRETAEAT
jgi:hypothetical protein